MEFSGLNQTKPLCSDKTKRIDKAVIEFLMKIKFFQDRAWKSNPTKAKSKRRLISGLREIGKYLELGAVKFVIIARDIENKQEELRERMDKLKVLCSKSNILIVEACRKHKLGKAIQRQPFVSAIAVLDYQGAEDLYNTMMNEYLSVDESN